MDKLMIFEKALQIFIKFKFYLIKKIKIDIFFFLLLK